MAVQPNRSAFGLGIREGYASDSDYLTQTGSTPKRGDFYYNTTDNGFRFYNGSTWGALGSAGTGLTKVRLHDPVSTTLPTGNPVTIDGVNVAADDLVLFSNLSSGANRVYKAVGTGSNITSWTAQTAFNGALDPTGGDVIIVQDGTGFEVQTGAFDGTNWLFNQKIRSFNGVDYWEQSSLNSTTINNNQSSPADVFSIAYLNSENIIVDYSIIRGTAKETGQLYIVTDGLSAQKSESFSRIGAPAVAFTVDISGSDVRLRYTSDNSGSSGVMKWSVKRWSDGAGGPGGFPSYSSPGSSITGTGAAQQIAIWSGASAVTGNANFTIDTSAMVLKLGSGSNVAELTVLNADSISSGASTGTLLFTYPVGYRYVTVEYSIDRGAGNYRLGQLLLTHDGTTVNAIDTYSEIGSTQITLASPGVTHTISGGNVEVRYNSAGGSAGTFKRLIRRWS